ncbi:MAG: tRNA (adenosine(37)-N6)-threonylcarbamoyltransferase complex ATPase subunit type 1 TsaE [Mangrovibacterium sp.]
MFEITIHTIEELPKAAAQFLDTFKDERHFAFFGSMGAGKTTFIKALCQHMGTLDNITSPTFALVNEYSTKDYGNLLHFDFYRLKDISEALDIGFEDYIDSGNYCFMEWSERVEEILPPHLVKVNIDALNENTRLVSARIMEL